MSLLELFSKLADEDDISSESQLFDCQEAMSMLDEARMGKMDTNKVEKLFIPLAKVAREQLEVLNHYCIMNTTCYVGGSKELLAVSRKKKITDVERY